MLRLALFSVLPIITATLACSEPARRSLVDRGDVTVEVVDRGTGPSLVLVPSLGRGCEDFEDLSTRLMRAGFRALCAEPRGIGRSTGPMAKQTLHDFADDLALAVEHAGAAPVVVLGHAFGNTVARTFATDRPAFVRGVVLVAASGRAPISREVRDAIARSSDLGIPDAERVRDLSAAYFAPGNDASVWLKGWHPAVQTMQWEAFRATKVDEYVPAGGRVPILDVQGDHDVIIPRAYSLDLKKELGDRVQVAIIPDAGHALVPEQPEALATTIVNWMRSLP